MKKTFFRSRLIMPFAALVLAFLALSGCSGKKAVGDISAESLKKKRVALFAIDGPTESRKLIETALVNEIISNGRFEIIDRRTVDEAKTTYPTEHDWKGLGEKLGVDYILSLQVKAYQVKERQGYDEITDMDETLAAESGEKKPIPTKRYLKVKSNEGQVSILGKFFDVEKNKIALQTIGEAEETINSRDASIGKLTLLEKLSEQALREIFNRLPAE